MNRETSAERRSAPRVDARLPLQLTEPDTRLVVTTESLDLSRNGLACRTGEYVAPLSKVAVTVILPPFGNLSKASRSLRAEGVVVRCEQTTKPDGADGQEREYDLACCFTGLEPDARNLLDAFVAWRLLRSVRPEEPRPSASHSSMHARGGRGAPRSRQGARPRPGGPRPAGGGMRGPRGPRPMGEGGRGGRGPGYGGREAGGRPPRGDRDRPPRRSGSGHGRDAAGNGGHARSGEGRAPGHYGQPRDGAPRGERGRPPRRRFRSEGREGQGPAREGAREGGREGQRGRGPRDRGRGGRPPRGGSPDPRRGNDRFRDREPRQAGPRPHDGTRSERPGPKPHERPEHGESGGREESRQRWGRRPSRRTPGKPNDVEPRGH